MAMGSLIWETAMQLSGLGMRSTIHLVMYYLVGKHLKRSAQGGIFSAACNTAFWA
jgi:hypothetical protein